MDPTEFMRGFPNWQQRFKTERREELLFTYKLAEWCRRDDLFVTTVFVTRVVSRTGEVIEVVVCRVYLVDTSIEPNEWFDLTDLVEQADSQAERGSYQGAHQSCGPIWRAMRPGADQFVPAHSAGKMEQAP
jgi:hypothetical protein